MKIEIQESAKKYLKQKGRNNITVYIRKTSGG